ncbi:TetR/AcrR family transcriptional regulator [Microbacterium luticocti]|uniref:TetR/AcrR family transcriptional regulator n=1 Tax=Microbacterium luticocti TaxID=451764 RepID=UPI000426D991|nr:TetR/AcrR family transcriptional regulator [Microbacterium luticocti]
MPVTEDRRRGSYAKGIAKREQILTRALDVIAREGVAGASVKQLAAAVGLSQAGLLHYFDSKEELFTAILRKRDEVDVAEFDTPGPASLGERPMTFDELRKGYLGVIRHNSEVPGLVQLFSRLAVDAADPEHPAHDFFIDRGRGLRSSFEHALAAAQADGTLRDDIDPAVFARVFQAVADGLQVQWMHESDVDMAAVVDALFDALSTQPAAPQAAPTHTQTQAQTQAQTPAQPAAPAQAQAQAQAQA